MYARQKMTVSGHNTPQLLKYRGYSVTASYMQLLLQLLDILWIGNILGCEVPTFQKQGVKSLGFVYIESPETTARENALK